MGVGGYASPTDTNFINISSNWATGQTQILFKIMDVILDKEDLDIGIGYV